MNVDPEEVKKFDDMAAHWWNPDGDCKPLHDLNPTRLDFILQRVDLQGKAVLDVGCGGGILTESLSKFSDYAVGLDASGAAIDVAKAHAQTRGLSIDYQVGLLEDYAQTMVPRFDVVTCLELIEHVPSPEKLLQDCAKVLKVGGDLFISTLNRTPKSFMAAILGAEYVLKMLPKGTHEYRKFIRPSELEKWASTCGFRMISMSGLDYNPFTRRAKLVRDVKVNYIVHLQKVASS
ncbi:MAG: bifunctional 3-demethylubiquinol 3-O-methyltransferase/2-polyprenyl-6-hydroxyphenol methylase [Legionellales bacterium]|nr:bifunctional 3-demethylubiquinol 3-O-methyltransferase/2-polyprenyl-6-hydroxyphenol methylase [Legionellales bacterium]